MRRAATSTNHAAQEFLTLRVTASRELASSDLGYLLEVDPGGGTVTLTIPDDLQPGWQVRILQIGTGAVLLAAGPGATVHREAGIEAVPGQWATVQLLCRGGGDYVLTSATDGASGSVFVNVRDFGAVGDGVADDTRACQNALAAAAGGTCYFPPGTYRINPRHGNDVDGSGDDGPGSLRPANNTEILLSPGATLQAIPQTVGRYAVIYAEDVSNIVVRGGKIVGDRAGHLGVSGEQGYGIQFRGVDTGLIEDCEIVDCWGDSIAISQNRDASPINSTDIVIRRVICGNARRNGLSLIGVQRCLVEDSVFEGANGTAPQCGVDIEPDVGSVATDIVFSNCISRNNAAAGYVSYGTRVQWIACTAHNNVSHGFWADEVAAARARFNTFVGCYAYSNAGNGFLAFNDSEDTRWLGCVSTSNTLAGFSMANALNRNEAINCRAESNGNGGFRVIGTPAARIIGCTAILNTGAGILCDATSVRSVIHDNLAASNTSSGFLISGDLVDVRDNVAASNTLRGFDAVSSGPTRCSFSNNAAYLNGESGIRYVAANDCQFVGNSCCDNGTAANNTHDGIRVGGDRNLLSGNLCKIGAGANRQRYGITIESGTANRIGTNELDGVTAPFRNLGTGTIFERSGTLSPAALASGSTNNYAPTNFDLSNVLRITPNATGSTLTGLLATEVERVIIIANIGSGPLTLAHDSASSTAANRFFCPNNVDLVIPQNGTRMAWYDLTSARWRVIGAVA